jgi:hypothetical protein
VSSDFAFWKAGVGDPGEIYDGLVDATRPGKRAQP